MLCVRIEAAQIGPDQMTLTKTISQIGKNEKIKMIFPDADNKNRRLGEASGKKRLRNQRLLN